MKKFLFAASAAFVLFLVSCSSKDAGESTMSAKAKKNLEINDAILKSFSTKDFSKFTDYVAADAVDHAGEHGDIVGAQNIRDTLVEMCKKMSDISSKTIKQFADDDWVFSWQEESGTMATSDMGMPAGTKYMMNIIEVSKFKDGKAVEHWSFVNMPDMMKMMMGSMQPSMEMKADTTHKM